MIRIAAASVIVSAIVAAYLAHSVNMSASLSPDSVAPVAVWCVALTLAAGTLAGWIAAGTVKRAPRGAEPVAAFLATLAADARQTAAAIERTRLDRSIVADYVQRDRLGAA